MYNNFPYGGLFPQQQSQSGYNSMFNAQQQMNLPRTELIKVSGENGANAYAMAPNSSAALFDTTASVVYIKTTDGAGYPTITPFDLVPHKAAPQIDVASLEARIKRLEEVMASAPDKSGIKSGGHGFGSGSADEAAYTDV